MQAFGVQVKKSAFLRDCMLFRVKKSVLVVVLMAILKTMNNKFALMHVFSLMIFVINARKIIIVILIQLFGQIIHA